MSELANSALYLWVAPPLIHDSLFQQPIASIANGIYAMFEIEISRGMIQTGTPTELQNASYALIFLRGDFSADRTNVPESLSFSRSTKSLEPVARCTPSRTDVDPRRLSDCTFDRRSRQCSSGGSVRGCRL